MNRRKLNKHLGRWNTELHPISRSKGLNNDRKIEQVIIDIPGFRYGLGGVRNTRLEPLLHKGGKPVKRKLPPSRQWSVVSISNREYKNHARLTSLNFESAWKEL